MRERETRRRMGVAEAVGTAVLVLVGPGCAVLAADAVGALGVAVAFGLALAAMVCLIGPVSGCHINPAVTLAMRMRGTITTVEACWYWSGQLVGGIAGAAIIYAIADFGRLDVTVDGAGHAIFASNGWGQQIGSSFGWGAAFLTEVVFTAVLVVVIIATTRADVPAAAGAVFAGLTLMMIHLVTIPVDNTSVNPARSVATAMFAGWGGAIAQLWLFIVAPLAGSTLGVIVTRIVTPP